MTDDKLIRELLEMAEWADANEYGVPLMLGELLRMAAERLERMNHGKFEKTTDG